MADPIGDNLEFHGSEKTMSLHPSVAFLAVGFWLFTAFDPGWNPAWCQQCVPKLPVTESPEQELARAARRNVDKSSGSEVETLLINLAIAGALIGLTGSLFWTRNRFSQMQRQLAAEKNKLHLNREMIVDQSNRLENAESLRVLAGDIAHDFNNLLIGVIANAEVLESRDELDDFSRQRIQMITVSARKAAELSQELVTAAGKHRN